MEPMKQQNIWCYTPGARPGSAVVMAQPPLPERSKMPVELPGEDRGGNPPLQPRMRETGREAMKSVNKQTFISRSICAFNSLSCLRFFVSSFSFVAWISPSHVQLHISKISTILSQGKCTQDSNKLTRKGRHCRPKTRIKTVFFIKWLTKKHNRQVCHIKNTVLQTN